MSDRDGSSAAVAPEEEEIDLDAWLPSDDPGSDLGEAYRRAAEECPPDDGPDADGPRVSDAYRSGS